MIQRIQSVYLIIILLISSILVIYVPVWITDKATPFFVYKSFENNEAFILSIGVSFIAVAVLALISLLNFKKRKSQFMLNRLNIIVNLYLIGVLLYYLLNLSGEIVVSEKGIGSFIPVLNIVLLALANKAIQKDEALVKSMDRLR
jgi:branched-subunit amino acid transport protein AzlD